MRLIAPIIIFISAQLYYGPVWAEEITQYEIQLAPSIGYSSFNGLGYGLGAKMGFALDDHWQLVIGGGFADTQKYSTPKFVATLGMQYNFSEDWTRSFYLAGGAGYGDVKHVYRGGDWSREKGAYGFLNFGKRIALNDSGTISWRPEIGIEAGNFGDRDGNLTFNPLNFSYSF